MGPIAPKQVSDPVERFDRDRKVFLSPDYKEEQLRSELLNPFFESLGWDVANTAGLTGACPERSRRVFKPVIREESIKIAGVTTPSSAEGLDDIFASESMVTSTGRSGGY
ncbi:MAG TPA: hypothetical protein VMH22_10780 [bacterium]|nr:hypothetical protein [bacterium]